MMASSLKAFNIDPQSARLLIDPSPAAVEVEIDTAQIEQVWDIIDYGWLTDRSRQGQTTPSPFPSGLDTQVSDWTAFLDSQMVENDASSFYMTQTDLMTEDGA
jgi:hypothetical protein